MSPDNFHPEVAVEHLEGFAQNAGGPSIYWQSWVPSQPHAVLLFVHGLGEHSGRYTFPMGYFSQRGFACWALDLRGHGKSSGRRVHVQSFDDYRRDVFLVLTKARQHHDGLPVFLVGHSMGGLVALRFFLDHPHLLTAAVLSSPALGAHPDQRPSRALQILARILSRLAPRLLFSSDLDANAISRSPEVVQAYRDDPLVSDRVSARWFTSIEDAMQEIGGRTQDVSKPILLMQSGADRLVDASASRQWADRAASDWVEYVEWPGLYHEMFNEPERDEVFRKMEDWLAKLV